MKRSIITIAGLPGSGKSTAADEIAHILKYERFSGGDFWRQVAREENVSVEELNIRAESDPSVDALVDDAVKKAGTKDNIVVDSRLAFHWIPGTFKVFLHIDPQTAAKRMYNQIVSEGRTSQSASSIDEVYKKTMERIESERKRYAKLYGVDYTDEKQFDLVVDTNKYSLKEVTETIVEKYKSWKESA